MTIPEMKIVPNRDLNAMDARKITERIKASMGDIMSDIAAAHIGRVWIALGYASWGDYIKGEFNHAPLSLPREERKAVVSLLRGQGMSTRAIAPVIGVDKDTVRRDLSGGVNTPPDSEPLDVEEVDEDVLAEELIAAEPVKITGLDGKTYTPKPQSPITDFYPKGEGAAQPAPPQQTVPCPTCGGTGKVTQP